MAEAMSIQVVGLDRVLRGISAKRLGPLVAGVVDDATLVVEGNVTRRAPHDTRALQRSIRGRTTRQGLSRLGVVASNLEYAPTQEFGRRRGAKMPPPKALAGWARRRGIPATALFVLARRIGKRGYRGRFYFKKGLAASRQPINALVKNAAGELARGFGR